MWPQLLGLQAPHEPQSKGLGRPPQVTSLPPLGTFLLPLLILPSQGAQFSPSNLELKRSMDLPPFKQENGRRKQFSGPEQEGTSCRRGEKSSPWAALTASRPRASSAPLGPLPKPQLYRRGHG